jgi:adenylate kinase family enzyme
MTKSEARRIIDSMPLPAVQAEAARRTIRRATTSEDIEVSLNTTGELLIKRSRIGKIGFQVLEDTIRPDGSKEVIQKAYDATGQLIHFDRKGGTP